MFWNRSKVVYTMLVCLGFNLFVLLYEEPALTRRYAEEYLRDKRHVPRWLPRPSPWEAKEN